MAMKYKDLTLGKIEALVNKIGGLEGADKFLKGETVISYPDGKRFWRTWKSIYLGTFKNVRELLIAIHKERIDADEIDFVLDEKFPLNMTEEKVNLACVSLKDLGLDSHTTWRDFIEQAEKLGLKACRPEVGPQLSLQYDMPEGEVLIIGMYAYTDLSDKPLSVFDLFVVENKKCISFFDPLTDMDMYEDACFVFELPNK